MITKPPKMGSAVKYASDAKSCYYSSALLKQCDHDQTPAILVSMLFCPCLLSFTTGGEPSKNSHFFCVPFSQKPYYVHIFPLVIVLWFSWVIHRFQTLCSAPFITRRKKHKSLQRSRLTNSLGRLFIFMRWRGHLVVEMTASLKRG